MKKCLILLMALLLLACAPLTVTASEPYRGYTYSSTDEGTLDVAAPQAYLPSAVYGSKELGVTLTSPEDLQFDKNGNLYVCDAGQNAIYVFSPDLQLIRTVTGFDNNGTPDTFSQPYGIFVTDGGELYVADFGHERVVALNADGSLLRIVTKPDSDLLNESFVFQPQKVLVDTANRLFVLSKNVNEGILQFTEQGKFLGFYGSNTVTANPIDIIWKEIMTEEQTGKLTQFVPVEYKNFSLDHKGFIYAVTAVSDVGDPIRRINLSGGDVLVRAPIDGSKKVMGDVSYPYGGVTGIVGPSSFVDITSDNLGNYYVLDDKRGRVFTYDEEGNLLFVFGALNSGQVGSFSSPSAIAYHEHRVYALDRANAEMIVFEPTEYARIMEEAMNSYLLQEYEESLELWEEIIKRNNNCDLAYYKAGYCLYRMMEYPKAMEYFKLVNAKESYSDAMVKYNQIVMDANFETYATVAAVVVAAGLIAWVVVRIIRKRKSV
ncbi:MAG: NHL repeat-containing protein [Clostridia bacterium]|nr:NHL repeat-containing protein [Clostridia bacterium]